MTNELEGIITRHLTSFWIHVFDHSIKVGDEDRNRRLLYRAGQFYDFAAKKLPVGDVNIGGKQQSFLLHYKTLNGYVDVSFVFTLTMKCNFDVLRISTFIKGIYNAFSAICINNTHFENGFT